MKKYIVCGYGVCFLGVLIVNIFDIFSNFFLKKIVRYHLFVFGVVVFDCLALVATPQW